MGIKYIHNISIAIIHDHNFLFTLKYMLSHMRCVHKIARNKNLSFSQDLESVKFIIKFKHINIMLCMQLDVFYNFKHIS